MLAGCVRAQSVMSNQVLTKAALSHRSAAVATCQAVQWVSDWRLVERGRKTRPRSFLILYILYISNELISTTDEGLDIVRLVGIVVDRPADFSDRRVNALFGLDVLVFPPDPFGDFLAGHDAVPWTRADRRAPYYYLLNADRHRIGALPVDRHHHG